MIVISFLLSALFVNKSKMVVFSAARILRFCFYWLFSAMCNRFACCSILTILKCFFTDFEVFADVTVISFLCTFLQ